MSDYVGMASTIIYFNLCGFDWAHRQRPEERIYVWLLAPTPIFFLALFALLQKDDPMGNWICAVSFAVWLLATLFTVRATLTELRAPKKTNEVRPRSDQILIATLWLLLLLGEGYWVYKYVP